MVNWSISVGNGINRYAVRLQPYDGGWSTGTTTMNVLALIKKKALKKKALESAKKVQLTYRGQPYSKIIL